MQEIRRLYILRHAKSSWDDPGVEDRERPLSPRGRKAVKLLAAHLQESGITPEQVLCSPARRTLETYEGVGPAGELQVEPELYGASGSALIARLHDISDETQSVMLIGHNPACQSLVLKLVSAAQADGAAAQLAEVAHKFPTGALASLEFSCTWRELRPGSARLAAYTRPRSLC